MKHILYKHQKRNTLTTTKVLDETVDRSLFTPYCMKWFHKVMRDVYQIYLLKVWCLEKCSRIKKKQNKNQTNKQTIENVVFIYWFSFDCSNCWKRLWFASLFILRYVIDEKAHKRWGKNIIYKRTNGAQDMEFGPIFLIKAPETSESRRIDISKRG